METIEFTINNYSGNGEAFPCIVSGEIKSMDALIEMGFTEKDGHKRMSVTGKEIMTFNGRRCHPIKNNGIDKWFVVLIVQ